MTLFMAFYDFFKENEAKERPPSTWPSASLAQWLPAAVLQTRPDFVGTQTAQNLVPHAPALLGCVERDENTWSKPFQG
jgi:hypothetical protein